MGKRGVFLEKSELDNYKPGIHHYAVRVGDDDWFEVPNADGTKKATNDIRWRKNSDRPERNVVDFYLAGVTKKDNDDIQHFNYRWIRDHPRYELADNNCQKYSQDLIQFLCPASSKCEIPFAQTNAWADTANAHAISEGGYNEARATTGKAGAQWKIFGVEAEGPSAGAAANDGRNEASLMAEASLMRVEGQVGPVGARFEPNVNTGVSVGNNGVKLKLLGTGFTAQKGGFGIHTSFGSWGIGKF